MRKVQDGVAKKIINSEGKNAMAKGKIYVEVKSSSIIIKVQHSLEIPDPIVVFCATTSSSSSSWYDSCLVSNLADQELGRLAACLVSVRKMSRSDGKGTSAYKVSNRAENLEPVRGIVGDSAAILQVFGVSEKHSAHDLVAHGSVEVANSSGCKSSALTRVVVSGG